MNKTLQIAIALLPVIIQSEQEAEQLIAALQSHKRTLAEAEASRRAASDALDAK